VDYDGEYTDMKQMGSVAEPVFSRQYCDIWTIERVGKAALLPTASPLEGKVYVLPHPRVRVEIS
jgi:hypothetical protein